MTAEEMLPHARRLVALLEDPHPGLLTWHDAVYNVRRVLWNSAEHDWPPRGNVLFRKVPK